jgi:hypothetical protein
MNGPNRNTNKATKAGTKPKTLCVNMDSLSVASSKKVNLINRVAAVRSKFTRFPKM